MNKIIVCGDSFAAGIGCVNLYEQPFGVLVAKHLGRELITLARGSASNFNINLQAQLAAEIKPSLVIIGTTSWDRVDWVADGANVPYKLSARNINYHQYPPHHAPPPMHDAPLGFFLENDPLYNPIILSEQVGGIADYLEAPLGSGHHAYYVRMHDEPRAKLKLITNHYVEAVDNPIKRETDIALILKSYTHVKRAGTNCIVVAGNGFGELINLIPLEDIVHHDWFTFSQKYPDSIKSLHASEEGHAVFAQTLLARIKENEY